MNILKKTLKWFLLSLIAICIIMAVVPYLFRNKIKAKILAGIDQNINARVNFSTLGLSAFKNFPRFTVTLKEACVTGLDDFQGDTLISAKEISVSFNLYKLIKGKNVEIKTISLEDPLIYARILANGKANYR